MRNLKQTFHLFTTCKHRQNPKQEAISPEIDIDKIYYYATK